MRALRCLGIATGALFFLVMGGGAQAGVDQWDFSGNLSATVGSGTLTERVPATITFTTAAIDGENAQVASFLGGEIVCIAHGFPANGGGSYVNQYTLIMDVMFPDTTAGYASLFQTNTANSNDGDWFLKHNAGIGISGTYGGSVADGEWHRLALVVDLVEGTFTSYVNGAQAMELTTAQEGNLVVDGRWSLDPEALLFADNDGEVAAGFVNCVQFRDEALTPETIAGFGGPKATGFPQELVEDFEQPDGAPEGWFIYGPTVYVQSGQLNLAALGNVGEVGTLLGKTEQPLWIDRINHIEARIAFPGNGTAWPYDHGGIIFCGQSMGGRYANPGTCYVIDYLPTAPGDNTGGRFRCSKFVNGAEQPLVNPVPTPGLAYEGLWSIDLSETEIIFSFDGVVQFRFADASLRGGYVGFWAYQAPVENRMTVDDLKVMYTPAPCPVFLTSKVGLTAGKGTEFATIRIPTGANFTNPYVVTAVSAEPAVAAPVGHTGGALDMTFDVGNYAIRTVEIEPVGPGETTIDLSAGGAVCAKASLPVEVLGFFAFEEHFTQADGPPAGWLIKQPTATVINEELSLRAPGSPFVWYAIQGSAVQVGKMERVQCRIKFARTTETAVGAHGGLVLAPAVTDARAMGYMIDVIERASDNGFRVYKDNNPTQIGGPRMPYVWDDQWHDWEVVFTPTGFTFSVDGDQKSNVQDLTYRGGYLAFWCYTGGGSAGQNMFVDDIRIEFGASYCPTIAPASAKGYLGSPIVASLTANAPYGSNFAADYSLTVTSTQPSVAVPVGGTDGVLVLTFPKGTPLSQTFEAECLSLGTTEFVLTAEGAVCPNAKTTFTVLEPSALCEQFVQPDGPPVGWTTYTGNWQVVDGELTVSCAAGEIGIAQTQIWAGSPPISFGGAATFEFSIGLTQTTPDAVGRHGGIMLFASAPTYRALVSGYDIDWIDRAEDHGFRVLRYDNGTPTTLLNGTPAIAEPGSTWRIELDGDIIRLFTDGTVAFEVADGTYREGYFGFWTYCNTTRAVFDDVAVGLCVFPSIPQLAGDCDKNGDRDISDLICMVRLLFANFDLLHRTPQEPPCSEAEGVTAVLNVNGDSGFNVSDPVHLAMFLFLGGTPPAQGLECFGVPVDVGCLANSGCE